RSLTCCQSEISASRPLPFCVCGLGDTRPDGASCSDGVQLAEPRPATSAVSVYHHGQPTGQLWNAYQLFIPGVWSLFHSRINSLHSGIVCLCRILLARYCPAITQCC